MNLLGRSSTLTSGCVKASAHRIFEICSFQLMGCQDRAVISGATTPTNETRRGRNRGREIQRPTGKTPNYNSKTLCSRGRWRSDRVVTRLVDIVFPRSCVDAVDEVDDERGVHPLSDDDLKHQRRLVRGNNGMIRDGREISRRNIRQCTMTSRNDEIPCSCRQAQLACCARCLGIFPKENVPPEHALLRTMCAPTRRRATKLSHESHRV